MTDSFGPIGVFDSGVGGLSILREVMGAVPHESIVYVADQRFAPYGERSQAGVAARSTQITGQLIEAGTDRHQWSDTFDRELTTENLFAIQDEIATAIVGALRLEFPWLITFEEYLIETGWGED